MDIVVIQEHIKQGAIKWSSHCLERMGERDISVDDVLTCINTGEVIEDYPDDFPHPSCLILGMRQNDKYMHVVVGDDGGCTYVITAYVPNTVKFCEDLRTRR